MVSGNRGLLLHSLGVHEKQLVLKGDSEMGDARIEYSFSCRKAGGGKVWL